MYNWVTIRKIPRTEAPNTPTRVAQTVDLTVRTWMPAAAALLACFVTPARAKLDARYYESPTYPVRAVQTVDTTVRTWVPTWNGEAQQFRTDARPLLDVRRYEWAPEFVSIPRLIDPTIAKWEPAFDAEHASECVRCRPPLDVRRYEWSPDEAPWIKATLQPGPSVAQTVPTWADDGGRTADRAKRGLFTDDWTLFGVPDDWVLWTPTFYDGDRTPTRTRFDVRAYDWSTGITTTAALSAGPTVAQTVPALAAHGDRTGDRTRLDVRLFDWAPIFDWPAPVVDAAVSRWIAVFDAELASTRTIARRQDPITTEPLPAWIFTNLPPLVTVAQTVPAWTDDGGRTGARPVLDVRGFEWSPLFDWTAPVIDSQVRTWIPIFDAELGSYRTIARRQDPIPTEPQPAWIISGLPPDASISQRIPALIQAAGLSYRTAERAKLDVRGCDWAPEQGWQQTAVDAAVARWAAIFEHLREVYRTGERPRLDVRAYEWAPQRGWIAKAVDAVVAKWLPIWDAEVSYRAPDHALLDVRRITDAPELAWLAAAIVFVPPPVAAPDFVIVAQRDVSTVRARSDIGVIRAWPDPEVDAQ